MSASSVALAPVSPIVPTASAADVRTGPVTRSLEFTPTALEWPYILSLPIVRQSIRNWAQNWAVYLAGLGKSGIGIAQSLLSIPGVTVEVIREVLELNFVGAFDTITTAIRDSVIAIGQPLLDSVVWRNQKYYLVEAALRAAVPQAIIDITNGFLQAGDDVVTSLIVGTQNLVQAILSFDLSNIVDAAIDGTVGFVQALGSGAGAIIDGVESAQLGITTALATEPPPPPGLTDIPTDITTSRTFADTVTIPSKEPELEPLSVTPDQLVEETTVVETPEPVVEEVLEEIEPAPEPPATPEPDPEPTAKPTQPKRPQPIRDALQKLQETIDKATGANKTPPAGNSEPAAGEPKPAEEPKPVDGE